MTRIRTDFRNIALLFVFLAGLAVPLLAQSSELPAISDLPPEWQMLAPGGETACLDGDEYSFFVRPADPDNLLVMFASGGACWSADSCGSTSRVNAGERVTSAEDNPDGFHGIFDLGNAANPLKGFTIVTVGYCTADFHLGAGERIYEREDGTELRVNHNGYTNAAAVMDWIYENVEDPANVVVSGWGGGATGATAWSVAIANHYSDARVRYLGDSPYLLGEAIRPLFDAWNVQKTISESAHFAPLDFGAITVEGFLKAAGAQLSNYRAGLIHTAVDEMLIDIHGAFDIEGELTNVLRARHADIRSNGTDLTAFVAGGPAHCVIPGYFDWQPVEYTSNENRGFPYVFDRYYTYRADGVKLTDWIENLIYADGQQKDHWCSDCTAADVDKEQAVQIFRRDF